MNESLDNSERKEKLGCWKRFQRMTNKYKKPLFFIFCAVKISIMIGSLVAIILKFEVYLDRPDYEAVCKYVISDDLDYKVDEDCNITVDDQEFTCDTEYEYDWNPLNLDVAENARKFTSKLNRIGIITLFVLWILNALCYRALILIRAYKSKIKISAPNPGWRQKLLNSFCENIIESSAGLVLFAITTPKYGDCFECWPVFMCNPYIMVMIYFGYLFYNLSVMEKIPEDGNYTINDVLVEMEADENGNCFIKLLVYFSFFCIYLTISLGLFLTLINYYSLAYSLSHLSGSFAYHLLILFYEEIGIEVEL